VRADEDVDAPFGEALQRVALFGCGAKARDVLERDWIIGEALGEGPLMLQREDRRRRPP